MNFIQTTQLSDTAAQELMRDAERLEFGKKEIVLEEGQRDDYTWFVECGSVRGYVRREDKSVILFFAFEGDAATWMLGQTGTRNARYTVQTLEPSVLLRIPRRRMEELFAASAELANWARKLTESLFLINEKYFTEYSWQEKSAQYLRILREYPELLQRVPLKDLAAYLFITPQTLSRIRARLK